MQAYRLETTIQKDGLLTLSDLPLRVGEIAEVIILVHPFMHPPLPLSQNLYPLRGLPVNYLRPTEPVNEGDWEALR